MEKKIKNSIKTLLNLAEKGVLTAKTTSDALNILLQPIQNPESKTPPITPKISTVSDFHKKVE